MDDIAIHYRNVPPQEEEIVARRYFGAVWALVREGKTDPHKALTFRLSLSST